MIAIPRRAQARSRDEFAAAVSATYEELFGLYGAEQVLLAAPSWANAHGSHSVSLPLEIAKDGGEAHGLASIVKHAIEMGALQIGRIAHVERDGRWTVYFETK